MLNINAAKAIFAWESFLAQGIGLAQDNPCDWRKVLSFLVSWACVSESHSLKQPHNHYFLNAFLGRLGTFMDIAPMETHSNSMREILDSLCDGGGNSWDLETK